MSRTGTMRKSLLGGWVGRWETYQPRALVLSMGRGREEREGVGGGVGGEEMPVKLGGWVGG